MSGRLSAVASPSAQSAKNAPAAAAAACSCCVPSTTEKTQATADTSGGIQRIAVDVSQGGYNPNEIVLKAGIPAEITFGQSSGCTAVVQSSDLGFEEDLTGGPKTVKLDGLAAGTYAFACGMSMVHGTIVVR
jgi:plastocyanin domain-containing protein